MENKCIQCQLSFDAKVYYQRFCSKNCRELYWLEETRSNRNVKSNLRQAKEIYLKSNSYQQAYQKLNQKDGDYLIEAMEFLSSLYPDRNISDLFEIIKLNIRK